MADLGATVKGSPLKIAHLLVVEEPSIRGRQVIDNQTLHPYLDNPRSSAIDILPDSETLAEVHSIKYALAAYWQRNASVFALPGAQSSPLYFSAETFRGRQARRVFLPQTSADSDLQGRAQQFPDIRDGLGPEDLIVIVEGKVREGYSPVDGTTVRPRLQVYQAKYLPAPP